MKRFLLFLCLVLLPSSAFAQWNYQNKAISDSLTQALLKAALADSLTTDYGIEELGTAWVDSAKVKPASIAGSNLVNPLRIPTYDIYAKNIVVGDSLRGKSLALTSYLIANGATILRGGATVTGTMAATVAQADSGYFGAVNASAYYSTEPPNQVLPLPIAPDTTYAVADTLNFAPRYDVSNVGLSREFLLAWGNGTTKADSVTFGSMFTATIDHPDSAVIMVRCSDSTAVSLAVIIRHVALDGTVTTIASSAVTNLRTTWQYIAIPLLAVFTKEEYSIEYQITAASSAWVEVSRVKFIGRVAP